jgi:Ca2+-binding RTX toxin-like protein
VASPPTPAVTDVVKDAGDELTTITGVSDPLSSVSVFDGQKLLGNVTADANGNWSLAANLIGHVVHSLTETATDPNGLSGSSAGVALFDQSARSTLTGGAGNDVLIAAPNDALTGGAGADTFVFNPGFGRVTVTDFDPTQDVLSLSHTLFSSAQQLLNHAVDTPIGLLIMVDPGDTITLTHVTLAQLTAHQATDLHFF